mgnify:CR=1 FL=1
MDSYANLGIAEVSGYLNVRKTPESFGEVIGKLPKGGACEILDTSTDGWYKISSGGVTGYVSSQYVYTGDEAKKLAAENVAERAVIDADKLNVRSEPKADATWWTRYSRMSDTTSRASRTAGSRFPTDISPRIMSR